MTHVADVTVVIPSRDRWKLLSRFGLRAALLQEHVAFEVVVVDDGSDDGTAERVAELGDPRVRVIRHKRSLGQASARNTGIAEARTDWVAFLDDDDVWSPLKLRAQVDAAERAGAAFAWCALVVLDPGLSVLDVVPAPPSAGLASALLARNVLSAGSSTVLARTASLRQAGGFDSALNELADWDLWIRLALGAPGVACEDVLVGYQLHSGNRRLADDGDVLAEYQYLQAKHADAASRLGVVNGPLHFSRWLAMGHRRRGERLRAVREYVSSGIRYRSPGNLARAGAALAGERAFAARRRLRTQVPSPQWLAAYR